MRAFIRGSFHNPHSEHVFPHSTHNSLQMFLHLNFSISLISYYYALMAA
jgi:hypothetical protein